MKIVSNKFRNSLRGVRRLSAIVGYYTDESYFILTTEDNKPLQTEDGNNLVTTETGIIEYNEGVINNVNPLFNTSLLKTTCKLIQIDCNNKIDVGTKINVRIGVYIPENDDFEYVNYGDYYIIDEPVYQADTKSYLITAYDKMVQSMVDYDSNPLSITYPITHKNLIKAICDKLGWEEELGDYDCATTLINEDIYSGQGLTYRDILDDLNGAMGGSLMFALDNQLICKQPTETNLIIEDEDLKDTNVDFGDKYGPVNALTISSNKDVIIDNREDSESIEQYGKTEFKLNDNLLMIKQSDDFIDNLFNKIDGLEYNIFDVSSTGILILEPLDIFTFRHDGVDYKTIMLNDDIQLSQGLAENLYVEKPEETESEYVAIDKNERKLNNAMISIDKANAKILLKADSNGRIVQARLDADADDGSVFEVKADNIKLEGYTTINEGFSVDIDGNASMKNGKINGGMIEIDDVGSESPYSLLIYDSTNSTATTRNIQVGDVLSGKTLKLSFPDAEERSGQTWNGNIIVTTNGRIFADNTGSATASQDRIYVEKNGTIIKTLYSQWGWIQDINLEEFELPKDFGTVTNIYQQSYLRQDPYDYIKIDVLNAQKYLGMKSNSIYMKDNNNGIDTNYTSDGLQIQDSNGRTLVGSDLFEQDMNGHLIYLTTNPDFYVDNFTPIMDIDSKFRVYPNGAINCASGNFSVDAGGNTYCTTLTQTSLKEKKKNFEKLKSGLDIIKNIDIYKYNLKEENDDDKKHIGFVIGDKYKYSKEITSKDNCGVDAYSFISVCCKAIQEQQEQIETLKKEIDSLKGDVK